MPDCQKIIKQGKCKADCCGPVPIDKTLYQITSNLRHRKVVSEHEVQDKNGNDLIIPFTEDLTCAYLDKNYKCSIYENRPELCREYGNGKHKLLTCPYK